MTDQDFIDECRANGIVVSEVRVNPSSLAHPDAERASQWLLHLPGSIGSEKPAISLRIKGRVVVLLPPTTNNLFRNLPGRGRCRTARYNAWIEKSQPILATLKPPKEFPCEVCLLIVPGKDWRQSSDVANREKAITDALVKAGVLPDDSCRFVCGVRIGLAGKTTMPRSFVQVWFEPRSTSLWSE